MPNWKKVIVSGSDASLNSLDVAGGITGSDVTIDDWGSISASLASINATGSNQNLQQVTDNGSVTTNSITASAFSGSDIVIDDWGSVSASLASIDSSVTLQDATDNGNTTTNDIILSGSLVFGLPDNNISIGKDSLLGSSMVQNIAIGTNALKSGSNNGINIAIGHSAPCFRFSPWY